MRPSSFEARRNAVVGAMRDRDEDIGILAKAIRATADERENSYEDLIRSLMHRLNQANVRDVARRKGLI